MLWALPANTLQVGQSRPSASQPHTHPALLSVLLLQHRHLEVLLAIALEALQAKLSGDGSEPSLHRAGAKSE